MLIFRQEKSRKVVRAIRTTFCSISNYLEIAKCLIQLNFFGGGEEDRTPDLCIANAALSQLSYPPKVLMSLATFSNLAKEVSSAAGATRGQLCEPDPVKFRMQ